MRPWGWSNKHARGVGGVTSIIADVNRVADKTTMTGVIAIGRDAIAVASTRGMVTSCSSITTGVRSRARPHNNEGGWRIHNDTSRKRRRRHGGVWATNAGCKEGGAVTDNIIPQGREDRVKDSSDGCGRQPADREGWRTVKIVPT
jgi:hypothetical protein